MRPTPFGRCARCLGPVGLFVLALSLFLARAQTAAAATQVPTTTYTQSTTWTLTGSPYVVNGDVTVASGATLTIEPGVIVKFKYQLPSHRTLRVSGGGTLVASGTSQSPIYFTSLRDDAIGGDTGGDGPTACSETSEYSYLVRVESANPSNTISHAIFRCGGYGFDRTNGVIEVAGAGSSLTATDVEVQSSMCSAFFATGGAQLTVLRATITKSCVGVTVTGGANADVEYTTITGSNQSGEGVRVEDGTVTVRRSSFTGLTFGAVIMLSTTTPASASTFSDNTITGNKYGVSLQGVGIGPLPPFAKLPYGHRNNIYANGYNGILDKQQLSAGNPNAQGMDWRYNYWGDNVTYFVNPAQCAPAAYVAYGDATTGSPKSPARWVQNIVQGNVCTKTYANLDLFSRTPFTYPTLPPAPPGSLLEQYAPELIYAADEPFSADSAAEITSNCAGAQRNMLQDPTGLSIASGCGPGVDPISSLPFDGLSLDYLGPTYSSGRPATDGDRIDENDDYSTDYNALLHMHPQYADQIYGRVVPVAGNPAEKIVQYWFFYYDQPNFLFFDTRGGHEGDWEGIQIHVDASGTPVDVTYSQHHGGERCDWSKVWRDGLHPEVFVAYKSHANYFVPGPHALEAGFYDQAPGDRPVIPTVIDFSDASADDGWAGWTWVGWPGVWGGTQGGALPFDEPSHDGPGHRGQRWDDPFHWQQDLTCSG